VRGGVWGGGGGGGGGGGACATNREANREVPFAVKQRLFAEENSSFVEIETSLAGK